MITKIRKYATGRVARGFLLAIAGSFVVGMIPALFQSIFKDDPHCAISVNGVKVSRADFEQESAACSRQFEGIRRQLGEQADQLMPNPREIAHHSLVQCALLDQVCCTLGIQSHEEYAVSQLASDDFWQTVSPEAVPRHVASLLPHYRSVLQGGSSQSAQAAGLDVGDLELKIDQILARNTVLNMARACTYIPQFDIDDTRKTLSSRKLFAITTVPFDAVVKDEQAKGLADGELQAFFSREQTKGHYSQPERRSGQIWRLTVEQYGTKVEPEAVRSHYDAHKVAQYQKEASKVAIRRIVLNSESFEGADKARARAQELRELVLKDPKQFAAVAKEHSQDKKSAVNGGLVSSFSRDSTVVEHSVKVSAFLMKEVGAISEILPTSQGYEIIQLAERTQAVFTPLGEVKEAIQQKLAQAHFSADLAEELHKSGTISAADRFVAIARDRGTKPEEISLASIRDSASATRLFRLEEGGSELFSDKAGVGVVVLSAVKPLRHPGLSEIREKVEKDLYAERASQRIKTRLDAATNPQEVVAWAVKLGGKTEDTSWVDLRDQKQLEQLMAQGMPVGEMLSLGRTGMFLSHTQGTDGQLIVLKEMGEPKESLSSEEMGDIMASLRKQRETLSRGGFVASLRRAAIIETSESVRGLS